MWTTAACIAWLASLGVGPGLATVDIPVLDPEEAGRKQHGLQAVIYLLPGLGLAREGTFDRPAFQVSVSGDRKARQFVEIEDAALRIDRAITFAPFPCRVGDQWLLRVQRSGGRPAAIGPQSAAVRTPFTASYITELSSFPVTA